MLLRRIRDFSADEQGQELIEYSLPIALIMVASAAILAAGSPLYLVPALGRSLLVDTITPPIVSGLYTLVVRRWTEGAGRLAESEKIWIDRLTLIVLTVSFVGMVMMTLCNRAFE